MMDKENQDPSGSQFPSKSMLENFDPLFNKINQTIGVDMTQESLPSFANHAEENKHRESEYLSTNDKITGYNQNSEVSNEYFSCEDSELKSPSATFLLDKLGREINDVKDRYKSTPLRDKCLSQDFSSGREQRLNKSKPRSSCDMVAHDKLFERENERDSTNIVDRNSLSDEADKCNSEGDKTYILNDGISKINPEINQEERKSPLPIEQNCNSSGILQESDSSNPKFKSENNGFKNLRSSSTLIEKVDYNKMSEELDNAASVTTTEKVGLSDDPTSSLSIPETTKEGLISNNHLRNNQKEIIMAESTNFIPSGEADTLGLHQIDDEASKKLLTDTINLYRNVVEAFLSNKSDEADKVKSELEAVKADLSRSHEDYIALENSFSELHNRYDKMRNMNVQLKENEAKLSHVFEQQNNLIKLAEDRITQLASEAEAKLREANEECHQLKIKVESDLALLQTSLKLEQTKSSNLEQSLQQKVKENEELTAICDELLAHANAGN